MVNRSVAWADWDEELLALGPSLAVGRPRSSSQWMANANTMIKLPCALQ
jgi:hypothetical protein